MNEREVRISAARYVDYDDCLAAAADDYAAANDLEGWDLAPRWEDEQRDTIVLTVPATGGYLTLNDDGQAAVLEFVDRHGQPGVYPAAWLADAERAANDAADGDDIVIEIGEAYAADGRLHTLVLRREWFR